MEDEKQRSSPEVHRPIRNFFKLVPVIEWFYPIDHRRLWKDAYNEAYPTGKALKESYKAVWEVHTIAAALVLSMNALMFFGLLTGESKDLYWDATPYYSIEWWGMIMGGIIVIINFVHLNVLLVVHGVYSAVDDDNFRAIVSARGPTGRFAMFPEYLIVFSMYGMAAWWSILLWIHVNDSIGVIVIIAGLLMTVTFLVSYAAYAARIIYHSGAHKPESIFKGMQAEDLPKSQEELGHILMERALNDTRTTMEPLTINSQIQKDLEKDEGWSLDTGNEEKS